MEAIVSAAICGTLKIVGNKLAALLIKEYSSIVGVKDDLQELLGLVEEINFWLETVGDNAMGSGPSFRWLKKLKDVSYDVDDVVDEFQLKSEKHEADGDGGILSKYLSTKMKPFIIQCKAAKKIKAIKKRFAKIVKQRADFSAIANSLHVGHPACRIKKINVEMPSLPIMDTALVLGRDQEKSQIISKLVETNVQEKIKIVSVVGLGGSGKTTVANLVFNDGSIIEKHFEVRLWVHVSQEFEVAKLIEKLFEAIAGEKSERYPLQQMTKTISENLTGKRYVLVLDDVWTEDRIQWEQFMVHLKSGAPGSRILLTTRSSKVAETVGSMDQFNLPFLSLDDSWQLFQQSLLMAAEDLDLEYVKVGKEIVEKCGGLPLAIKILAGALSGKERIEEWQAMRDNNLLDVEGQELNVSVSACLRLSYSHLPSHLQKCFAICSVFPKGHKIDKEQLIDQWISHEIISRVPGCDYLEYIGHKCFSSLVQMSFLQDVVEYDGRVRCMMHDLVHDLARSIFNDEISVVVPKEATNCTKTYRYFSLSEGSRDLPPKNIFERARAIYIAKGDDFIFGKSMKNAKHLRSITVEYVDSTSVHTAIMQIKNLRYFSISGHKLQTVPESISDIWSLQALHVTDCFCLLKLPESIGKLHKLRTLNLSGCTNLMSLPDSIGDCHMISRMDLSHCKKLTVLPNSVGRNNNLRVLRLGYTAVERLPSSITTLENLECLDLRWCGELVELPEGIGNLEKLRVLNLEACKNLSSIPVGIRQLSRLRNLSTFVVGEDEKSARISELANVARRSGRIVINGVKHVKDADDAYKAALKANRNLQRLCLNWSRNNVDVVNGQMEKAVLDGLEPPSGIKKLYIGGYGGGQFAQWMQKQLGGRRVQGFPQFPHLTMLILWGFPNLKHMEGLVELPCLEDLRLVDMPSLESISGGPFPSLVNLGMDRLLSLGDVWMVTERTSAVANNILRHFGLLRVGSHQPNLIVQRCPKLVVRLLFPSSLQWLEVHRSNKQMLQSSGEGQGSALSSTFPSTFSLACISVLEIGKVTALSSSLLPLQHLDKLKHIEFKWQGLRELPESVRSLTSLRCLSICMSGCSSDIVNLSKALSEVSSLREVWTAGERTSMPDGAEGPQLEQKTNLQKQEIWLRRGNCSVEASIELDQDIVDGLEDPSRALEELTIRNCPGRKYAWWMLNQFGGWVPFLRVMKLWDFPNLKHLNGTAQLPCLEELELRAMPCLESISGGPFPSLVKLSMSNLPSLGELWLVAGRSMVDGQEGCSDSTPHVGQILRVGDCVSDLSILDCPKLKIKPYLPLSLQTLRLSGNMEQLASSWTPSVSFRHLNKLELTRMTGSRSGRGWEVLQHMTALEELVISFRDADALNEFPLECLRHLTSLTALAMFAWPAIPESLGELRHLQRLGIYFCDGLSSLLPKSTGQLTSLETLTIGFCDVLDESIEFLAELRSLRHLRIIGLPGLTCLPQSICSLSSLEVLCIAHCPGITSLPEGIKGLTALQRLDISGCPDLTSRCERRTGEDWHLISHIPFFDID